MFRTMGVAAFLFAVCCVAFAIFDPMRMHKTPLDEARGLDTMSLILILVAAILFIPMLIAAPYLYAMYRDIKRQEQERAAHIKESVPVFLATLPRRFDITERRIEKCTVASKAERARMLLESARTKYDLAATRMGLEQVGPADLLFIHSFLIACSGLVEDCERITNMLCREQTDGTSFIHNKTCDTHSGHHDCSHDSD